MKPPPPTKSKEPRAEDAETLDPNYKIVPEIYYGDGVYWLKNAENRFIIANIDLLRRYLKLRGFSGENTKSLNSEIDTIITKLADTAAVDYVGAVAGYDPGVYEMMGNKVLITRGPTWITPQPNYTNSMVYDYIERLLADEAIYYHGWLKLAREAMRHQTGRRGQCLVLAGKPNHGKSFLAKHTAAMLGGRVADPSQYLQGKTTFNAHMFAAEFLLMDDQGGSDDYQTRKAMADGIKQLIAGAFPQCHGKGSTPISLTPFWRLMITVNDEYEPLQVLPNMEGGVKDKMIVLQTVARAIDRDTTSGADYEAFEQDFIAAIPDYLGWLDDFVIPEELTHGRFGLVPYVNPEIDFILHQFTPEQKLMHMIQEEIQTDEEQRLTAREIETILKAPGISRVEREASALLRGPGSCGKYLTRVAKHYPTLLTQAGRIPGGGTTLYQIHAKSGEKS